MAHYITLAESYDADKVPDEFCDACRMYIYDGLCDCVKESDREYEIQFGHEYL